MIFSVFSDRSENENITAIIVIVMIVMILRGDYYYYYYYYYKLMPMALVISFLIISLKNETSSAGLGARGLILGAT